MSIQESERESFIRSLRPLGSDWMQITDDDTPSQRRLKELLPRLGPLNVIGTPSDGAIERVHAICDEGERLADLPAGELLDALQDDLKPELLAELRARVEDGG